ncbi:MAG TPA: hypothetical protein VNY32_11770 [Candidatus Acidoferrales bacterium]|jgi:hypothetical protein|nr:hypothetical protein [Candidatus Acidoferrales bacterium]
MAKRLRRSKKLLEADRFHAQVVSLLGERYTDWEDFDYNWLFEEARRPDDYAYTDRERVILNRLIARATVFTHYSEHSVQELIGMAHKYPKDLNEDGEAFIEKLHRWRATKLRVRQIARIASIVRLSYPLPRDKEVAEVIRATWGEDDTELPPYVPYEKTAAG